MPLNPGPFNVKEHVLITIMGGVGAASAYATDIIAVQRVFYNQNYNFGYQWMLVMSTQLIGFAMGGIGKRFLVSPPSMSKSRIWLLLKDTTELHFYSLARKFGFMRALQYPPLATLRRDRKQGRTLARTVLCLRILGLLHMVFLAGLHFYCALGLLVGDMDCTSRSTHKPIVWIPEWIGHVAHHV